MYLVTHGYARRVSHTHILTRDTYANRVTHTRVSHTHTVTCDACVTHILTCDTYANRVTHKQSCVAHVTHTHTLTHDCYRVASVGRIDKIIGLFCKTAL